MIYVVVPTAMEGQWLEPLRRHYADDANVEVIVDRRRGERRDRHSKAGGNRQVRDRRRARVPGSFPQLAGD